MPFGYQAADDVTTPLKGRRDLLSRNDFNWPQRETPRIATLSQHSAF
jgi:hypothetical protein